ncbi:MAG: DUF1311 domain-containing protein [Spartobacteria bacterium]|nr:DUF1311 domain-containing protein [Spartobacteria bacterium]
MRLFFLPALILMVAFSFAYSQEKKDPIEVRMDAAMRDNPSTAGMLDAIKLKKRMPADEWVAFVQAQKSWLAYRDVQIESLNTTYSKMEGTMWLPARAHAEMDLTKQRAQFLKETLDLLSER